jgi:serine/tyrosine/threonine adenylyltransferase
MSVTVPQAEADNATSGRIAFDNTYATLPERFFERIEPTPVAAPRLIALNDALARTLGLDPAFLKSLEGVAILAGNRIAEGSAPLAQAYAGHQFGNFVPQLGDGRAVLLGEVIAPSGERFDIQLKGSGPTRFSRRGDGRAALGPVIREYIVSEAMAALGLPTTRSLAAVMSGEPVIRERMLPGGVLTRVASSHLRVGTFEYFAAREDIEGLRLLADYAIGRHYPEAAEAADPYLALFEAVAARLAELVARWMQIGFIHGVLNTDNTSIAGETIDYGPCAFMDAYHPRKVFSSIDRQGRYAYENQPGIVQWNLARLGECLLPLFSGERNAALAKANEALGKFGAAYQTSYLTGFRRKLGLFEAHKDDEALISDLLTRMAEGGADFTLTFRALSELSGNTATDDGVRDLFTNKASYDAWAFVWRERLSREPQTPQERGAAMRSVNPKYIPRNHRVEAAIAAAEQGRFNLFEDLNQVLARPYDDQPAFERYAAPPRPEEEVSQTFCGT